jgi:hypothetical protein
MVRDERAGGRESSYTEYPEEAQGRSTERKADPYPRAPISTALTCSRLFRP